MMRLLAVAMFAVAATTASAFTQQVLPGYTTTINSPMTPVANTLYCATVPAYKTFTGTKFAGDIATADAGSTSGFAIYPDSDGGTALATVSGSSAAAGVISGTGKTIPLVAGTRYRICTCSTSTLVRYTAVRSLIVTMPNALMNAVATTSIGTAANACTTGAPPSTTGAITASTTVPIPIVLVEE